MPGSVEFGEQLLWRATKVLGNLGGLDSIVKCVTRAGEHIAEFLRQVLPVDVAPAIAQAEEVVSGYAIGVRATLWRREKDQQLLHRFGDATGGLLARSLKFLEDGLEERRQLTRHELTIDQFCDAGTLTDAHAV